MSSRSTWVRLLVILAVTLALATACKKSPISGAKSKASPQASASAGAANGPAGKGAAQKASPSPVPSSIAKGAPLAGNAIHPADPGRYTFDESGNRSYGGCGSDGPPPTPTTGVIDPPDGSRQKSIRDRRDGTGQGLVVTSVFEFREDGVYLIYLSQEQYTPIGRNTTEFEPSPPPLVFPGDPKAGQSWQFVLTSKDGKVKVDSTSSVEASSESVTLGSGESVSGVRIRRTSHVTGTSILGNLDFVENSSAWVSLQARQLVKEVTDTSGTVGTCKIATHVEVVLHSSRPQ